MRRLCWPVVLLAAAAAAQGDPTGMQHAVPTASIASRFRGNAEKMQRIVEASSGDAANRFVGEEPDDLHIQYKKLKKFQTNTDDRFEHMQQLVVSQKALFESLERELLSEQPFDVRHVGGHGMRLDTKTQWFTGVSSGRPPLGTASLRVSDERLLMVVLRSGAALDAVLASHAHDFADIPSAPSTLKIETDSGRALFADSEGCALEDNVFSKTIEILGGKSRCVSTRDWGLDGARAREGGGTVVHRAGDAGEDAFLLRVYGESSDPNADAVNAARSAAAAVLIGEPDSSVYWVWPSQYPADHTKPFTVDESAVTLLSFAWSTPGSVPEAAAKDRPEGTLGWPGKPGVHNLKYITYKPVSEEAEKHIDPKHTPGKLVGEEIGKPVGDNNALVGDKHAPGNMGKPVVVKPGDGAATGGKPVVVKPVDGAATSGKPVVVKPGDGAASGGKPVVVKPGDGAASGGKPVVVKPGDGAATGGNRRLLGTWERRVVTPVSGALPVHLRAVHPRCAFCDLGGNDGNSSAPVVSVRNRRAANANNVVTLRDRRAVNVAQGPSVARERRVRERALEQEQKGQLRVQAARKRRDAEAVPGSLAALMRWGPSPVMPA